MAKKMRRMVATLLALCMCISAATVSALAEETPVDIQTTVGTVEGTQTTTETSAGEDGNATQTTTVITQTPEGGVASNAGDKTTTVEYQQTEITSTTNNANGDLIADSGSVEGKEVVTETCTSVNSPIEEELLVGSVEISFDAEGKGSGTVDAGDPTAPSGAENVREGNGSVSWESTVEGELTEGAGNGTDVDGDGFVDTITTQTTTVTFTSVTITDRTVNAELSENSEVPSDVIGNAEAGDVEGIGGAELPQGENWTTLTAQQQAQISKIQDQLCFGTEDAASAAATQLALDVLLNGKEIPEDTDAAVKAAAQTLIDTAKQAQNSGILAEPATPEISISNVSLTVDQKADVQSNKDFDNSNDVFNASVKFDVYVTEDVTGEMVVVIKQGDKEIAAQQITDFDKNDDGSYTVTIQNMQLEEGVAVNMDVQLDGIQQLSTTQMFSHTTTTTTTTQQPVQKYEDLTLTDGVSVEGQDKHDFSKEDKIADTEDWNEGSHNQNFTVGEATINIKANGTVKGENHKGQQTDLEVVTVTSDKTIKADYITVKAGNGYIRYAVPGGILVAGVEYTVVNIPNTATGKTSGISHVCVFGTGEKADIPTETITTETNEIILGSAGQSREVTLNAGVELEFTVDEATKTTNTRKESTTVTTRSWEEEYSNTYEVKDPDPKDPDPKDPDPENPDPKDPDPQDPDPEDPNPNNPPAPQPRLMVRERADNLVAIEDEAVPLADAPKTGDFSAVLLVMSMASGSALAVLNRKRKDEEE